MSRNNSRINSFIRVILKAFPFLFLFLFRAGIVSAQDDLSDSIVIERLGTIKQMFLKGKANDNWWWYGWLIGYSAATVVQGTAFLISEDKSTRQDMALGAATTFIGAVGQVIMPIVPGHAPDRLNLLPEGTREERMNKLYEAEKLLRESARNEKNGKSWKTHAIYGIANLSGGLITWIGFDRNIWAGIANFALNTAVTEAQIFTQPTRAMRDYKKYQKKYNLGPEQSYAADDTYWTVNAYPGGIVVRFVF
jgi:hypothetical protein